LATGIYVVLTAFSAAGVGTAAYAKLLVVRAAIAQAGAFGITPATAVARTSAFSLAGLDGRAAATADLLEVRTTVAALTARAVAPASAGALAAAIALAGLVRAPSTAAYLLVIWTAVVEQRAVLRAGTFCLGVEFVAFANAGVSSR